MKILMSTPVPFFRPRGTPLSTFNRCKVLSELGHKIDLITYPMGNNISMKNFRIFRIIKIPFINDVGMGPSAKMFILDVLLSLKMFLMCLKEDYDCIHAHEETIFAGVILKKIFKKPLIYDMHTSIPEQLTNYGYTTNRFFIGAIEFLEKWAVKNSDVIIVICPRLRDIVHSISPYSKVFNIENRPVVEVYEDNLNIIENLRRELKLKDEKVVLYTGNFGINQGLEMLLETAPIVRRAERNFKYVLVGGDELRIEHLKKLSNRLNIDNHVIFTGSRPIKEMPSFMALSDILASPRITGINIPLKIYSYLKSGTPIVATDVIAHTQILDTDMSMLVKPEPNALAEGIIRLLKDPKTGRLLGEKAKRISEKKYSYTRFAEETKKVYNCI